ncbi:MAG: hypothetical protein R3C01_02905 [Planctomycetaceae bacterium]
MFRIATIGSICVWITSALCGCSSFLSARAIDAFSSSLEAKNMADIKANSSKDFEGSALRREDSLAALDILKLPTRDFTVRDVEDLSPTSRLVTVAVGKDETLVKYRLKREDTSRLSLAPRWVVDDVIMTRGGGAGASERSVTEQMNLLLTIQDFLAHWSEGSREQVISTLSPEMQAKLSPLPPVFLSRLTRETLDGVRRTTFNPEVNVRDNQADVSIARAGGKLMLKLEKSENSTGNSEWRITSIVAGSGRSRNSNDVDVIDRADLYGTVSGFLEGYRDLRRDELARVCTEDFYKDVLELADLTSVPLPVEQLTTATPTIEFQGKRVEMVFDLKEASYLVSLQVNDSPTAIGPGGIAMPESRYRVEELTIYEGGGKQIKPLTSLFTAQATVELYAEMLASRDAAMLKTLSTSRFNEHVWDRITNPALSKLLPLNSIPNGAPHVVTTVFLGPRTEVMVTQGTRALTYVLQSNGGRPQVDDILVPSNNQTVSLRESLESAVPVLNFAGAWQRGDKRGVEQFASEGLQRLVFLNSESLPEIGVSVAQHLLLPYRTMKQEDDIIRVTLGDGNSGAEVKLVREKGFLVIEDFSATGPEVPGGQVELASTVRSSLLRGRHAPTNRIAAPVDRLQRSIQQAGATQSGDLSSAGISSGIQHADFTTETPPNLLNHQGSLLQKAIPIPGITAGY